MAEDNDNMKMLIIIALLVIIIAAGTSFTVMKFVIPGSGNGNSDGEVTEEANNSIGPTYVLGNFTVNLANSGGYKFVKASITAEISDEKVIEELDKRKPQIRDIVISILRAQEIKDIEKPDGTELKNLIKQRINNIINDGKITSVWFTQFVVQ